MSLSRAAKFGCSGTAYDSRSFREFFSTVESCFQIVSGAFPCGKRWPRGRRGPATVTLAIKHPLAMKAVHPAGLEADLS